MPTDDYPGAVQNGARNANTVDGPADGGQVVTQAMITNSTDLTRVARGLYVGGDGDVVVRTKRGETLAFQGVKGGTVLPIRIKAVLVDDGQSPAVTTTAASTLNLIALY